MSVITDPPESTVAPGIQAVIASLFGTEDVATLATRGLTDPATRAIDPEKPLHLLHLDDPQELPEALATLGAREIRPWVVTTEGPDDGETPPLVGYRHVLFDGTHDYYLADEHIGLANRLARALADNQDAQSSIRRWRASALEGWSARGSLSDTLNAAQELINIKQTLSWRVTRPLRAVRSRVPTAIIR